MNTMNNMNRLIENYIPQFPCGGGGSITLNVSNSDDRQKILERQWALYGGGGSVSAPPNAYHDIYPIHIARRGRTTVVWWNDGTKTHVTLEDGRTDGGVFAAFCIAYAKRCFGSTTRLSRTIDEADEQRKEAWRKRRLENQKKMLAIARKTAQDAQKAAFQKRVQQHVVEMRAKREAHRLLEAEEKKGR